MGSCSPEGDGRLRRISHARLGGTAYSLGKAIRISFSSACGINDDRSGSRGRVSMGTKRKCEEMTEWQGLIADI